MTNAAFTPEQWQTLTAYGLACARADDQTDCRVAAEQLLEAEACLGVLARIEPALGAPNVKVTASLTLKRWAFLVLAPSLSALSCFNKGLDVSLPQCIFDYRLQNRIWQSTLPLKWIRTTELIGDRAEWRQQALQWALAQHLTPVVESLHRLTRTPMRILWENVAVRVFSIYERRILPSLEGEQKALAQADYQWLLSEEASAAFGLSRNPIAEFDAAFTELEAGAAPVRVRRTCCYYYRATDPAQFCSNCPLPLRLKRSKKSA